MSITETAVRIAEKYDIREFDVIVDDRGRVSMPCFDAHKFVGRDPSDLCIAVFAHGFLDIKAERKHDQKSCQADLASLLYEDFVDYLMDIARQLVRLNKLTSDVRGFPAAVEKCLDDGVTPAACTELVLRTFTTDELEALFD